MKCVDWCAVLAIAAGSCVFAHSAVAEEVGVTPYRPTVSTPAALSAIDWVEVEIGVSSSDGGALPERESVPYTVKLAFSDNWGIRIGGELLVRDIGAQGRNIIGSGDTAIILKRRFAVTERSAFGLEVGVTAPTAPIGLHSGSGRTDYGVLAIYSTDIGATFHTDINLGMTRLGLAQPSEGRDLQLWAAALSKTISERWGLAGELSETRESGAGSTSQFLFAATYSPRMRVTWDVGLARGMTMATPPWSIFAGCTFLATRL